MHVVILQPYLAPYRVGLFRALQREPGIRLTLLLFGRPERRRQWGDVPGDGLRCRRLCSPAIPVSYERNWTPVNVPHLFFILLQERPDVVVCAPAGIGRWIRLFRALLHYRIVAWTEQTVATTLGRTPSARLQRWMDSGIEAYLVPGRESRTCLRELYRVSDDKIHEAPNTVDAERYAGGLAARWTDATQPLRVVFVGSLHPRKGVDLLLAAAREVRRQLPSAPWELHLAGCGPLKVGPEPGTIVHGQLDEQACAALLVSSHLFVLPSRYDCNPLSAIEAAHAGLVPLLSDGCGNFPELAAHGWVFPRNNGAALVTAMLDALQRPRAELRARAEATRALAARFSHENSAAAMCRVFRLVMERAA